MAKDLRSENDNLQDYRKRRGQLTEILLNKSIDELIKLKAVINQKTVCEMMDRLAHDEDKKNRAIISPSAISKNKVYKNMIIEAKEKIKLSDDKDTKYKIDGDKQLEIFQLKTLVAQKEAKIKELESIIKRANIEDNTSIASAINTTNINYKSIVLDLKDYILHEGISYIDNDGNLIDESTGDILITSNIFKDISNA
ncbi:hypothetical protein B0F89_10237 [Malaciobacter marinus]|jgi:small-conductance mechanosensitive channel|uniref:Uncharacterized protein n=1 Tax=Malaciobacter marinus TaxID=505249 RepID=A0AB36ZYY2_9BACT|nr:hypothetical protein [Malaciobacter marinus]PPK62635.1 hypothetical protein B0F89_10237 [Malaciobacter marinus]